MSPSAPSQPPHLGLLGATGIGVGAIVGGGILALAGVAFATTGPSAILAFALNGCIAFLTVFSFAELAARFPHSGGTYTYARRVLSVEAAFGVGWIVWFASVVAAVLYAMGFAVFLVPFLEEPLRALGVAPPQWLSGRLALVGYALAATGFYTWRLTRSASGGGQWETGGKVVAFGVLLLAGFWVLAAEAPPPGALADRFRPFFAEGAAGLAQAMGYTFIALQGFDLIAAVGGEVKKGRRNVPRAMFLALGTALAIYLPLLFLIVAVGSPGRPVTALAGEDPEILVAAAARNFLGPTGYWLVLAAGLLSMLSALQANLLAASRFARTMGSDRTLPRRYAALAPGTGTPTRAARLTAVVVAFLLVAVPNVAAAGAVASLIFLASFALTHAIAYLARKRVGRPRSFRAPLFPAVPVVGGGACLLIGLYQAVAVPSAGVLAALWLAAGAILYALYLAPRARVVDASSEALDPQIVKLRGRRPIVLVPIANPASAETLVTMAKSLAPRRVSRVQLLSVVGPPGPRDPDDPHATPREIIDAQHVLGDALATAFEIALRPEARITIGSDPWAEIARVAAVTKCESILLGIGSSDDSLISGPMERLAGAVDADVVILRAPAEWKPDHVRRILIPSGGGRVHSPVRARLLGSLGRTASRHVTFMAVLPEGTDPGTRRKAERDLQRLAWDEVAGPAHAEVAVGADVAALVAERAADADLVVLGLQRRSRREVAFGEVVQGIARATDRPLLMISSRRPAS